MKPEIKNKSRLILSALFIFISLLKGYAASPGFVRDSVLTVPSGVKEIPPYAYADRTDIVRVEFQVPATITTIGEYAFLGCSGLQSISLPSSVARIGEGAFRECMNLKKIIIPQRVSVIPRYAFAWCESLREAVLPTGVKDISAHAFAYCYNLENVEIPSRVEHIGSNAFVMCESLREIKLPASIKELESYAFAECRSLKRAVLPANSNLLGELIFTGCGELAEIVELSPVPPKFDCESTLFDREESDMYLRCRLRVLPTAESAYLKAPGWKLFFEQE